MEQEVWAGTPDYLFVPQGSGFLMSLTSLPCCQGPYVLLEFLNYLMHVVYGGILDAYQVVEYVAALA